MNIIGKVCLALTLLYIGLILAVATNTYGSKGATLIITKEPSRHVIYGGPIMDFSNRKQPATTDTAENSHTSNSTEKQLYEAKVRRLFDPLHLSHKTLNAIAILLFGLGIAGVASIFRKSSGLQ